MHLARGEWQVAQEHIETLNTLSMEYAFPLWRALGTILQGCLQVELGNFEEGPVQIAHGLDAYRATGAVRGQTAHLIALAKAQGKAVQPVEGLETLTQALAWAKKTGEQCY